MTHQATGIRRLVAQRDLLIGVFLQMGSPVAAEIAAGTGIDWAVIDLEHGAGTEADLLHQLQGLAGTTTAALVRVESLARLRIGRVLDLGAAGVMVPQINTPQDAAELASFVRYQPAGSRGVALSARGAGYGAARHGDVAQISDSILTIAQIETGQAVENAPQIAAVDGIDVLFVGPSDLSHSLGVPGQFDASVFGESLDAIAAAARQNRKSLGVNIPAISEFERYYSRGFRFISVGGDGLALAAGLRSAVSAVREAEGRIQATPRER